MGVSRGESLDQLLNSILDSFLDLCQCDGGSVFTFRKDEAGEEHLAFESMRTRSLGIREVPVELRGARFGVRTESLVGRTAASREFFRLSREDLAQEGFHLASSIRGYAVHGILSAPLITPRGDLVGVVQLLNKIDGSQGGPRDFDDRDQHLLSIVASQAALAIENSLLLDEQEALLEGFVNACVTAVEARDPVTSGHSQRVCDATLALAEAVNRTSTGPLARVSFSDVQLREIRFAAMLHDIGKISVSETLLNKEKKLFPHQLEIIRLRHQLMIAELLQQQLRTGIDQTLQIRRLQEATRVIERANEPRVLEERVIPVLEELGNLSVLREDGSRLLAVTPEENDRLQIGRGSLTIEERDAIEEHVSHTFEILKAVPWSRGLEGVPTIAHKHHEKLDGTGYPRALKAPEIPIQSRLITICDIYDALTADDRPYKPALSETKALEILSSEVASGKLDPTLMRVFLEARVYESVRKKTGSSRKKAA
jgi:HD-GYP domain-containing protein (c-di-GMP phosphodiesterase class II)